MVCCVGRGAWGGGGGWGGGGWGGGGGGVVGYGWVWGGGGGGGGGWDGGGELEVPQTLSEPLGQTADGVGFTFRLSPNNAQVFSRVRT